MSKSIEADREADRKVIQTRNYNDRHFNLNSMEKQGFPVLVRDTEVEFPWFYMSKKVKIIVPVFDRPVVFCRYIFVYKTGSNFIYSFTPCCNKSSLTIVINGSKLPWQLKQMSICHLKDFYS